MWSSFDGEPRAAAAAVAAEIVFVHNSLPWRYRSSRTRLHSKLPRLSASPGDYVSATAWVADRPWRSENLKISPIQRPTFATRPPFCEQITFTICYKDWTPQSYVLIIGLNKIPITRPITLYSLFPGYEHKRVLCAEISRKHREATFV